MLTHPAAPPARRRRRGAWIPLLAALAAAAASATVALLVVRDVLDPARSLLALPSRESQLANDLEELFSNVAEAVKAGVVAIGTRDEPEPAGLEDLPWLESIGSGFVIDPRGYILTNHHLIGNASTIDVRLNDNREFKAKVIETNAGSDVALIKIQAEGLHVLQMGTSKDAKVGQWVLAIGSPFGLSQTVSAGIISATRRADLQILPFESYIQTDASINPGNSGGPLVNLRGEVIGINTAMYSNRAGGSQGIGFAVPIDLAKALALRWIAGKRECYLGIRPARVDRDMAHYYGMEQAVGAFIAHVGKGSPAQEGGLRAKDLVLSFDGTEVRDENHLRVLVASSTPGEPIEVEVLRGGARRRLTVTPLEKEGPPLQAPEPVEPAASSKARLLGITVTPLDAGVARQLKLPEDSRGMAVIDVQASSPAARKGVRPGDVIVEVNDRPVENLAALRAALELHLKTVLLGVRHGGGEISYFFLAR